MSTSFTAAEAAQQTNRDDAGKYQAKVSADPTMLFAKQPPPYTSWPLHSTGDGKLHVNGAQYNFDEKEPETRSQAENALWAPNLRGKQKGRVVHLGAFRGRQSSIGPLRVVAPDDGAPLVIVTSMSHPLHVLSGNVVIDATRGRGGSVTVEEGATCEVRVAGDAKYRVQNSGGDVSVHADGISRVSVGQQPGTAGSTMIYGGGPGCTVEDGVVFMTNTREQVNIYQPARIIPAGTK
jgi:hypothetical protein